MVRQRNPGWLLAGVLLVLVSAIGGVLIVSAADDRHSVLVAAADIEAGRPLERRHLRIVELSAAVGVATVDPGDATRLLGRTAVGPIPAGTVLNTSMFSESALLGDDEMVFGAALDPGEAPVSSVPIGATVRLLATPRAVVGAARPDGLAAATVIGDGVVWDVEPLGSGEVWLSIRTAAEVGLVASKAAQDDELRVVVVGGGPEPGGESDE